MSANDHELMQRALALAERAVGRTRPNPPVGAVVVDSGGRVVGEGFHHRAGEAHAEVHALNAAGQRAVGGSLYVTLEPCSSQGRTPPCTHQILKAGVRRVVVGTRDPNPKHRGRGIRLLRRHGLAVETGICRDDAARLIEPFARWVTSGRPLVTLKLATTLDGRLADRAGRSKWITSPAARSQVQELRRGSDVIMVGIGTVLADDPSLTYRRRPATGPMRLVVDSTGRLPLDSRILTDGHAERTIIATTHDCPANVCAACRERGAQVWFLPRCRGKVSLRALVTRLGREGNLQVLCEGGGRMAGELFRQRLVDRLVLFTAPVLFGDQAVASVSGSSWPIAGAPKLRLESVTQCGPDVRIDAVPRKEG